MIGSINFHLDRHAGMTYFFRYQIMQVSDTFSLTRHFIQDQIAVLADIRYFFSHQAFYSGSNCCVGRYQILFLSPGILFRIKLLCWQISDTFSLTRHFIQDQIAVLADIRYFFSHQAFYSGSNCCVGRYQILFLSPGILFRIKLLCWHESQ